jgi:lipopolysaccharide/colanic/teichoic acid biosynthesis glycosyltransferase
MTAGSFDSTTVNAADLAAASPASTFTAVACRALDIVVALLLLIVLAPILLVVALVIRIDSPGWPVFRQRRVGRDLKPFTVNKFRTMRHGAKPDVHKEFVVQLISGDGSTAPVGADAPFFKLATDERITRIGGFLRRTSLDELPQLWNVLRGDMSLVGPRPPIPYEVDAYPPHWYARFDVKPGLTGLWQINGRSRVTLEEMIRMDVDYAQRRTLWLNLKILLLTVPAVVSQRGAR